MRTHATSSRGHLVRIAERLSVVLLSLSIFFALPMPASATSASRPGGGQNYAPSSPAPRAPSFGGGGGNSTPYAPNYSTSPNQQTYNSNPGSSSGWSAGAVLVILFFAVILVGFAFLFRLNDRAIERQLVERQRSLEHVGRDVRSNLHAPSTDWNALLRERDAGFTVDAFVDRARRTMEALNNAWSRGELAPVRAMVSDGVYVRFRTQLALMAAANERNVMGDWELREAAILNVASDERWDTIDVKLRARARDATVPLDANDNRVRSQVADTSLDDYEEVWSFLRRRGVQTTRARDTGCPRCGAELPPAGTVKCAHCSAIVNSGEHDWVLAEITQPSEWTATSGSDVASLAPIRARDGAVSRQAIEDRASVIFWKWIAARGVGKRADFNRFCRVPDNVSAPGADLADVAVGSADVCGAYAKGDGLDHVDVEIRWSARRINHHHVFTLARAVLAKTSGGLSCLDCPKCGGPLAESDSVACMYCGATLAGRTDEWMCEAWREV
jgi:hypothetical protein